MPNPTPVYVVTFSGSQLNGYVQSEDLPLLMRVPSSDIIGRDGGIQRRSGAAMREVSLSFRYLSRLAAGTGMDHLDDIKDQWREDLATLIDTDGPAQLKIGETDRYLMCEYISSSEPLSAFEQRGRATASHTFRGNPPYFLGTAVSGSQSVSGNTTVTTAIGDTRRTYPIITIPTGITRITIAHAATGKSFTLSGSHASPIIVDCASLQITMGGANGVSYLTSTPDFGIYHVGSGSLVLSTSNVTGSGTVSVIMQPRYGR